LLRAAEDPDVQRCFRIDDIHAPECYNALQRYPLISQFTYDYRFRFTLCQALGDACGGRPPNMLQNGNSMQQKALFNPGNADPAVTASIPGGVVIAPANNSPTGPTYTTSPATASPTSPTPTTTPIAKTTNDTPAFRNLTSPKPPGTIQPASVNTP